MACPAGAGSPEVVRDADAHLSAGDHGRPARRASRGRARAVMGEDVGVFGGAFKVTDGFVDEFGGDRVMDTPLAESAIIGCAIGAAVVGMRPVCEMQFSDFISCGFDQLVNVAGKMHYRQGLAVPITVRLPSGGGFSGGPFHSQNPEAWFMHSPGIKVVAPSTAEDAKGLLAHGDPRPESRVLHGAQAPVPAREGRGPGRGVRDPVHRARGPARLGPRRDRVRSDGARRDGGRRGDRRKPRSRCSTCAHSCPSTATRSSTRSPAARRS